MHLVYRRCPLIALRAAAGGILVVAAALKFQSGATEGVGRAGHLILISFEYCLGILLLLGVGGRRLILLSALLFAVFGLAASWKWAVGSASCGCFGRVTVHPAYTATLDFIMSAGLFAAANVIHEVSFLRARRIVAIAFAIPLVFLLNRESEQTSRAGVEIAKAGTVSGNVVVLESSNWVGEAFPLGKEIEDGNRLLSGDWLILLVHDGCVTCEKAIPNYAAHAPWGISGVPKLAIIDVFPITQRRTVENAQFVGQLGRNREWMVSTPTAIALRDGVVLGVNAGADATKPDFIMKIFYSK